MKKFSSIFQEKEKIIKVILKYFKSQEHYIFDCFTFKESTFKKKYILLLRRSSPLFPLEELVMKGQKVIYNSFLPKFFAFKEARVFKIPEYEDKHVNFCTIFIYVLNAIKKGG